MLMAAGWTRLWVSAIRRWQRARSTESKYWWICIRHRADGGVCRMFQEKRYQDKLVEVWDRIARRYKGREVVYAYDLLNEAVEGAVADGLLSWRDLATKAAETIREVDPGKPGVWGRSAG